VQEEGERGIEMGRRNGGLAGVKMRSKGGGGSRKREDKRKGASTNEGQEWT
jgi:hypothetical protein